MRLELTTNGDDRNCLACPWTGIGRNLLRVWVHWIRRDWVAYDLLRAVREGQGRVGAGILWLTVSGSFEDFTKVKGRKARFVDLECTLWSEGGRVVRYEVKAPNSRVMVSSTCVERLAGKR